MHIARRFVLLSAILTWILPLSGAIAVYRSNSIGMQLEEIPLHASIQDGFMLEVDRDPPGNVDMVLKNQGTIVYHRSESSSSGQDSIKRVLEIWYDSTGKEIESRETVYRNDLPETIVTFFDGSESQRELYSYAGFQVQGKVVIVGEKPHAVRYARDAVNNSLIASYTSDGSGNTIQAFDLFGNVPEGWSYAQASGDSLVQTVRTATGQTVGREWKDGLLLRYGTLETNDQGLLVSIEQRTEGAIRKTFNPQGLMILEEFLEDGKAWKASEYSYDKNGLPMYVRTSEIGLSTINEWWYDNGKLSRIVQTTEDKIAKSTRVNVDGTTLVTLYETGRPYVDVVFGTDGKTVLSVSYREEWQ